MVRPDSPFLRPAPKVLRVLRFLATKSERFVLSQLVRSVLPDPVSALQQLLPLVEQLILATRLVAVPGPRDVVMKLPRRNAAASVSLPSRDEDTGRSRKKLEHHGRFCTVKCSCLTDQ